MHVNTIMYKFIYTKDAVINYNNIFQKPLAESITLEQGKTLPDAEGDVLRGLRKHSFALKICHHVLFIEVVEHACSITNLQLGETLGSVTKDMDTYTYREPIGVCAGVTPFNFPAMIPLWVGNYTIRPSSQK